MFEQNFPFHLQHDFSQSETDPANQGTQFSVMMDQNISYDHLSETSGDKNIPIRITNNAGEKSNKCNQCSYASSHAGHLRTHKKTHSGEKSNKCNQCDFALSYSSTVRIHLQTHSGPQ